MSAADMAHANGHPEKHHHHETKAEHNGAAGHTQHNGDCAHDRAHDRAHNHHEAHTHSCDHDHGSGLWAYLPHSHGLHDRIAADRRSLQLASGILCVSLTAQLIGGLLVNSSVLEAEAVHTALDGLVLLISLVSISLASRRAAPRYSYGYGRAEVLSALVSVVALALMCLQLFAEATQKLFAHATSTAVARRGQAVLAAEALTLINNVLITSVLARNSDSLNIRALRAHVIGDSIGNIVVLVAGAVMWSHPNLAVLDPLLTILVVIAIAALNVPLARETLEVLMQAAPRGLHSAVVAKKVGAIKHVRNVSDVHVWTLTSGVVVASLKVEVHESVRDYTQFERVQSEAELVLRDIGVHQTTVQVRTFVPTLSDDHEASPRVVPNEGVQRGRGHALYTLVGDDDQV